MNSCRIFTDIRSHYSLRLKGIADIQTRWQHNTFKKNKQEYSVLSLLISPNVSTVSGHALTVSASFPCAIYSLHKDGSSANELWRFHKNWLSSTMSVKADRTKLLFNLLIPWRSSVKAVAVYLKLKLKEKFVKFPPEIMPCACCWSWKSQSVLREIAPHSNFLEWRRFAQWKLSRLGWDFEMPNGAVKGQLLFKKRDINGAWQSRHWQKTLSRHVSKLCVKTLFISENFHS